VIHRRNQDSNTKNKIEIYSKNLLGFFNNKVLKRVISLRYLHVQCVKLTVTTMTFKALPYWSYTFDLYNFIEGKIEVKSP